MTLKNKLLKKILGESVLVGITDYFAFGVIFITSLLINRNYGTAQLGTYTLCIAIAQIFILSFGGSFSIILRRDIILYADKVSQYLHHVVLIRILITLFAIFFIIILIIYPSFYSREFFIFLGLIIFAKGIDSVTETFLTLYQTIDRILIYIIVKTINNVVLIIVLLLIINFKLSIKYIYWSYILISLSFFLVNLLYTKSITNLFVVKTKMKMVYTLIQEAWPLFVNTILFQLNSRGGIVIISFFLATDSIGVYTAGTTLIFICTAFISSLSIVFFPYLTRSNKENPENFMKLINKIVLGMLFLGIIIYLLFVLFLPYIIKIYGHFPVDPTSLYYILAISIIPMVSTGILGYMFTILHAQKQGMFAAGIILVINFILFYLLTYAFNLKGTAIAFTVSQIVSSIIFYVWIFIIIKDRSNHLKVNNV